MKRYLPSILFGVWMINPFLQMLSVVNPPLYQAFIDSGATLWNCVDWDAHGHVIEGVCLNPPPGK